MRFLSIFLFLLVAGFGWALWQGIDLIAAHLEKTAAEDPPSLTVENVEFTAAEQASAPSSAASAPIPGETPRVISESLQGRAAGDTAGAAATPAVVSEELAIPTLGAAPEITANTPEEAAATETPEVSAAIVAGSPAASVPEPTAAAASFRETRRITGNQVNLRQGPDADTPSLGLLSLHDPVEVLEARGDWLRLRTGDGQEGWVAARFVAAYPG